MLKAFRAAFVGKASPVHFFWGSFDLAVTRFSGRPAPPHPGGAPNCADWVMREAYSHEVSSCGFWPGGGDGAVRSTPTPTPSPRGFAAAVQPEAARYDEALGQFLLPYEAVRTAPEPDRALLAFLQSTYEAAADLGGWDRAALERDSVELEPSTAPVSGGRLRAGTGDRTSDRLSPGPPRSATRAFRESVPRRRLVDRDPTRDARRRTPWPR